MTTDTDSQDQRIAEAVARRMRDQRATDELGLAEYKKARAIEAADKAIAEENAKIDAAHALAIAERRGRIDLAYVRVREAEAVVVQRKADERAALDTFTAANTNDRPAREPSALPDAPDAR